MKSLPRAVSEALLLGACVLAPALPPVAGVALLAGAWWLWRGAKSRSERVAMGSAFALAGVALLFGLALDLAPVLRSEASWTRAAEQRYEALLAQLGEEAHRAAREMPVPDDGGGRLQAFRHLLELRRNESPGDTTLLLFDPDGETAAWSGPGLRHELTARVLPRIGLGFVSSFRAATLFAAAPVDPEHRRPWRVVAGRSFSTAELPFPPPPGGPADVYRWSPVPAGAEVGEGRLVLQPEDGPELLLDPSPRQNGRHRRAGARFAWLGLGIGLLALAALRAAAALSSTAASLDGQALRLVAIAGAGAASLGIAAAGWGAPLLALFVGIAVGSLAVVRPLGWQSRWRVAALGAAGIVAVAGASLLLQRTTGLVDLAETLTGLGAGFVLRLALWASVIGVWGIFRQRETAVSAEGWAWTGLLALLIAGALHDRLVPCLLLLAVGGATVAVWSLGRSGSLASLATLVLLAALGSATAWEAAYREVLKHHLAVNDLPLLAPPTDEQIDALASRLDLFFGELDLSSLHPGDPAWVAERQDLPLAVWERSPLAQPGALSAIVVIPDDGPNEEFTYGLPVDEKLGVLDRASGRWPPEGLLVWAEGTALAGEADLVSNGARNGEIRYWLIPRPDFGLEGEWFSEELEVGLLRGAPLAQERSSTLPGGARYAIYDSEGPLRFSPWEELSTLDPARLATATEPGPRVIDIGDAAYWAWSEEVRSGDRGGLAIIVLPRLGLRAALTRVALHTTGTLLVLCVATLGGLLFAMARPSVRAALRRNLSSYSKRLIAVYTLLLVVPLLLINLFLVRGLYERLESQQRSGGEAALKAAQRILGDYLPSLRPGFSVATAIDDSLLSWLSQVVRHEVNLYWRGEVSASSKPELFAAGLMPRRIPGEVYSRLTLLGAAVASRTNQVGRETSYLELYAPLSLPGEPAGQGTLFLSVPLLAQQEELAAELLEVSRQALLITTALFLLLVAVGGRLARSFTTPLMQIVRGTGRIAAGETSLHLQPSEPELASLVAAIDDMAQRIAEGRSRLLREKQVIEGMVENITAGVVSLDRDRRVLMRNRVAAELLGLDVGDPVERAASSPELAPLADFLEHVDAGSHRATATLRSADGSEHDWTLVWVPVPGDGSPSALLVVEDVTEVLRGQRLEAWAEMARIIAHEIKNPLTPIRLSAEHLQRVYGTQPERFDEIFERCTSNILAQVDELQQIAAEFSTYSHIPRIDPRPGDLAETVARVTEGYRASPPPGVAIRFQARPETLPLRHDARLLGRAVRNLVENAVRASAGHGEVDVRVEGNHDEVRIVVADRGPGVPAEQLRKIFDPYFSTSSGGTGLGLPIARRIAEEHGGSIEAHNREGGGLEVVVTIPRR